MARKHLIWALMCLAAAALTACGTGGAAPQETEVVSEEAPPEEAVIGLANPASVYCEDQGYTLEIRADESGGEYGVCIFPDGSECEEWAFFRGECAPGGEAAPEEAGPALDRTDLAAFQSALVDALSAPARDYDALQTFMGDSFEIQILWGDTVQMAPPDAATTLQFLFLPEANQVTFVPDADIAALIGSDPSEFFPAAAGFLLSEGWGAELDDDALLVYAQDADGNYFWSGILFANDGFAAAAPAGAGETWYPPSGELCTELQADVAATLGVGEMTLEMSAPLTMFIPQAEGTGCVITVTGTGVDFNAEYFEIFMQLKEMLEGQGWVEDVFTSLDGPTGTGRGFRRDNAFLMLVVGWSPSDDADCPTDQPIFMCELTPEQRLFEIMLSVAEQ
jgi:putative hemolysin